MNFQQLRIIRETARRNYNLTEVASALYTSQSGVSKHIKDLEDELGVALFVRRGKRLLGMTDPGKELLPIVERMLHDAANVRRLAEQFANRDEGRLSIVTTHTQARYKLPELVAAFRADFPKVHLELHQSDPPGIVAQLVEGEADIGIATEALAQAPELVSFPWYSWHHAVVVPVEHRLAKAPRLTLPMIAEYPIVTYHEAFAGRRKLDSAFAAAGLSPDVVLAAIDSDVIKTYVELGLGIGIIAPVAYDPQRDRNLALLPCDHLFASNTTSIALRRGHYLRSFGYAFLQRCLPELTPQAVREQLLPGAAP